MANIQPFDYQKSTNIEEHNQIVNKVNEIVQVINDVNLDTINSEIANLKANATATDTEIANIKNKDLAQDTEIDGINKNLVTNVAATFDNPSRELKISLGREASPSIDATVVIPSSSETGQYSAGNGITIQDYQIAVDTGVVALKTDIPVVPDVTEINNRLDTIDGEITGINADITNITNKNTEQDTAINGKVAIAQGIENAGKVLGIGADGNVTPVNAGGGSGGESDWVLSTNPLTSFITYSYEAQYNRFIISKDLLIRVAFNREGNYSSINDIYIKKGIVNIANNTSMICVYTSAIDFSSSSRISLSTTSNKDLELEVGGATTTQSTNESDIVTSGHALYWIYTKS